MRSALKSLVVAQAFIAFALLNPMYLLGCGLNEQPRYGGECSGPAPTFDYTEADMRANLEAFTGHYKTYEAATDEGLLRIRLRVDRAEVVSGERTRRNTLKSGTRSLIASVAACSYTRTKQIPVVGYFSATFEHSDGRQVELYEWQRFEGMYEVESLDAFENGSIKYSDADGLRFKVGAQSGVFEFFEILTFVSPKSDAARIQRGY